VRSTSVGREHFERLYAARPDPWHYETSDYERAKYAATLASLPRPRYARALDVGCSIGVLTEALARRCDDLLAIEPVEAALEQARRRNAGQPHLRFAGMMVPEDWPQESFDLIVISEVLDYLGVEDLQRLAERLRGSLAPDGDLLLVHWVAKKGPQPRPGEATDVLAAALADVLVPTRNERNSDFRLDLFRRRLPSES
jgi:2-polyprenyl-3-methyl-5-hydroxy-6-metoxy-1,4-benzoquinol methylase